MSDEAQAHEYELEKDLVQRLKQRAEREHAVREQHPSWSSRRIRRYVERWESRAV